MAMSCFNWLSNNFQSAASSAVTMRKKKFKWREACIDAAILTGATVGSNLMVLWGHKMDFVQLEIIATVAIVEFCGILATKRGLVTQESKT